MRKKKCEDNKWDEQKKKNDTKTQGKSFKAKGLSSHTMRRLSPTYLLYALQPHLDQKANESGILPPRYF